MSRPEPPARLAAREAFIWNIGFNTGVEHASTTQCGWIDEFGNVYPMGAWKPAQHTYHDDHKTSWQPIYKATI